MLFARQRAVSGTTHSRALGQQGARQVACQAKRGRPRKKETTDALGSEQQAEATAKRKGRPPKRTDVEAAAAVPPPPAQAHHEQVISIENMTSSADLDYTDDMTLVVPSYTHQAQGHDSNDQPPLEGYTTDFATSPFLQADSVPPLGSAAVQQQSFPAPAPAPAPAAPLEAAMAEEATATAAGLSLGHLKFRGLLNLPVPEGDEVNEQDLFTTHEEPPGVYDYEAGLAQAITVREPERKLEYCPPEWRPRSRRQADYLIRWTNWVGTLETQQTQFEYEDMARRYMCMQNNEAENIYLNAKAMSIVTAEIELEDHETGNRQDMFYPVWARAEHRWYPTGRFAAYNQYVKDTGIDQLTMKLAPGADQEEEFDLMDDVFLMADDPNLPGSQAEEDDSLESGPAGGLALDNFLAGVLPGTNQSELGASYLDDLLSPEEEPVEEELD